MSLFYIDLDRFKPVNDEYGHEIGDALLAAVGERLQGCTRATDVIARLGGDEFAILVTQSDPPTPWFGCPSGSRQPSRESFMSAGDKIRLGASVGRSVYPD